MMSRRKIVIGALAGGAALPAMLSSAAGERPRRPTSIRLHATELGYSITVNGEVDVELSELDAEVLRRAMSSHFGMSKEEVRRDARIYIYSGPGVPYSAVLEVMRHVRFERVGLVAEERAY